MTVGAAGGGPRGPGWACAGSSRGAERSRTSEEAVCPEKPAGKPRCPTQKREWQACPRGRLGKSRSHRPSDTPETEAPAPQTAVLRDAGPLAHVADARCHMFLSPGKARERLLRRVTPGSVLAGARTSWSGEGLIPGPSCCCSFGFVHRVREGPPAPRGCDKDERTQLGRSWPVAPLGACVRRVTRGELCWGRGVRRRGGGGGRGGKGAGGRRGTRAHAHAHPRVRSRAHRHHTRSHRRTLAYTHPHAFTPACAHVHRPWVRPSSPHTTPATT